VLVGCSMGVGWLYALDALDMLGPKGELEGCAELEALTGNGELNFCGSGLLACGIED